MANQRVADTTEPKKVSKVIAFIVLGNLTVSIATLAFIATRFVLSFGYSTMTYATNANVDATLPTIANLSVIVVICWALARRWERSYSSWHDLWHHR